MKTLDRLAPEPGRQALVVFSDGADRYSQVSAAEMLNRVCSGPALVYPIVFGRAPVAALAEMASLTGGRSFVLRDAQSLAPALASIARELRHQYLLGYVPAEATDPGRWHPIVFRVRNQGTPGLAGARPRRLCGALGAGRGGVTGAKPAVAASKLAAPVLLGDNLTSTFS